MIRLMLLFSFILGNSFTNAQVPASGSEAADKLAQAVIDQKWKAALKLTSSDVQKQLSPTRLTKIWEFVEIEYGAFDRISSVDTQYTEKGFIARYRLLFERTSLDLMVVVGDRDEITSFVFQPLTYQLPDRMLGKVFNTEHVVVKTDTFEMDGEMMIPDSCDHCPVVVIVHGSGPSNRNLDYGPNKIYFDLAVLFAERGIATFRYDKRTYVYPDFVREQKDSLTVNEITVNDALSAIRLVRENHHTESSPVFVLGHSLGAIMAPRISEQDGRLNGIILAAGPTMPLHHLIEYQFHFLFEIDGKVSFKERKVLKRVKRTIKELDRGNYYFKGIKYLGVWGGAFWEDLLTYDPVQTTAKNNIPALVLFCERDYQVPPDSNTDKWFPLLDSSDRIEMNIYPGLNHLFLFGEGEPNRGEYLNPGHFSDDVIRDMTEWIKKWSNYE